MWNNPLQSHASYEQQRMRCLGWGYGASAEDCVLCWELGVSAQDEVSRQKVGCLCWGQGVSSRYFSVWGTFQIIWGGLSGIWVLNSLTGEILTQKAWDEAQGSLTSSADCPGSNLRYWSRTLCKNLRCFLPSQILFSFFFF